MHIKIEDIEIYSKTVDLNINKTPVLIRKI